MKQAAYDRARDAVLALNRFIKPHARLRAGERKSHFQDDHDTGRSLITDSNILGFGVGPKLSKGAKPGESCLVVFVRRKLPKSRLRGLVTIPPHLTLQTLGHRIRTDVQPWGRPPEAQAIRSGDSIGDLRGNSGTMTLAVKDRASQSPLLLSCSHVLAMAGDGEPGDGIESPANLSADPTLVGTLLRFSEINRRSLNNMVDAAVGTPADGVELSNAIPGVGTATGIRDLTRVGGAALGVAVQGLGASSGRLEGTIRNIHVTTSIVYHQLGGDPSVHFVDLVQYDAFCQEGDSGTAILDTSEAPLVVGMHIASSAAGLGLFTHIRHVFDELQITLLDEDP